MQSVKKVVSQIFDCQSLTIELLIKLLISA